MGKGGLTLRKIFRVNVGGAGIFLLKWALMRLGQWWGVLSLNFKEILRPSWIAFAHGVGFDKPGCGTGPNGPSIGEATWNRLESGKNGNPTLETLSRVARALGKEIVLVLRDQKKT